MGVRENFEKAWLLHQKRNPHHWQYWLLVNDNSSNEFTLQEPGQGYEIYLSRNNRPLAMFDESILFTEDKLKPNYCNDNAFRFANEIRNKLNKYPKILDMPLKYRKEMLADWIGAGKAINGFNDVENWYKKNKNNLLLHDDTREWIEEHLKIKQVV